MNTIYLWPRQLELLCRACAQAYFFREGAGHIMQFSTIYQFQYNREEQNKILRVINDSSVEELSRFDISDRRINNLQQLRCKRGPFCTLEGVLKVDGLGVKGLEKLCNSILKNGNDSNVNESEITKHVEPLAKRSKSQILTPILKEDQIMAMQTAVGIHIGVSAVTWAHIDRSGNILAWDIYNLDSDSKKQHITALFDVAKDICENLAKGDIYVLEDKGISTSASNQQQPATITVNVENFQLIAMIVALLNDSAQSLKNEPPKFDHLVFFLRSRLSARLFRTLVGSERVSAQSVVLDILSQDTASYDCSPINVSDEIKEIYLNRTAIEKESLCRALLLIMTFMDLAVRKNSLSLQRIKNRK